MTQADDAKRWYIEHDGEPEGPLSAGELRLRLVQAKVSPETMAYGPGMTKWEPLAWLPEFAHSGQTRSPPPVPKATYRREQLAHDVDFQIHGEEMQYVEIELDPEEAAVAEAGTMLYMDSSIGMEAVFGTGNARGMVGHLAGAGKRLLTGESLFLTVFTNHGDAKQRIAFAAPYPGKIIPVNLAQLGGEIVCQKEALLCAAKGVSIDIAFQKRIGVALFGGEGFIMQKLTGDGLVFIHAGGTLVNRRLGPGETLKVDSGCLAAMESGIDFDIEYVGGIKSAIFGGEGVFFTRLTGPGNVWLQSMPFSRLAGRIHTATPGTGNRLTGEGSVLGGVGKLFER